MSEGEAQILVMIVGAPAVGKMTVGKALSERTGLPLFHNHASIEPVLPLFTFGEPPFIRVVEGFRHAVLREVAASSLPGMIFTYAWAFDLPSEEPNVESYVAPFRANGAKICFVELRAPFEVRAERNEHPARLEAKPSKRLLERSRQVLRETDEKHRLTSDGDMDGRDDWLIIDNTHLTPERAADQIIARFDLR